MDETVHSAVSHSRLRHRRGHGSGRVKTEHTRCERVVMTCYPEDLRDLGALCTAWDVTLSTLVWSVVQDWLMRARGVSSDLDEARGPIRMCMEIALRDRELGPWLRAEIARNPQG
jgi:hypothetical protein